MQVAESNNQAPATFHAGFNLGARERSGGYRNNLAGKKWEPRPNSLFAPPLLTCHMVTQMKSMWRFQTAKPAKSWHLQHSHTRVHAHTINLSCSEHSKLPK